MLIEQKYANQFMKGINKYRCDRCKTNLTVKTRYQLAIAKPNSSTRIKYADLCPRCMRALDRGIKKGIKSE